MAWAIPTDAAPIECVLHGDEGQLLRAGGCAAPQTGSRRCAMLCAAACGIVVSCNTSFAYDMAFLMSCQEGQNLPYKLPTSGRSTPRRTCLHLPVAYIDWSLIYIPHVLLGRYTLVVDCSVLFSESGGWVARPCISYSPQKKPASRKEMPHYSPRIGIIFIWLSTLDNAR